MATQLTNEFIILGPSMSAGWKVLEAASALCYLPQSYKLVLTGSENADQFFYKEVLARVEQADLGGRVEFVESIEGLQMDAVILPNSGMTRANNTISGDSPEALASAVLDVSRA